MLRQLKLYEISQISRFFVRSGLVRAKMDATAFFGGREKTRKGQSPQFVRGFEKGPTFDDVSDEFLRPLWQVA